MELKPWKIVQFIGLAATCIGTLCANWADEKEMEEVIEEKVNKAMAKHEEKEESEEV